MKLRGIGYSTRKEPIDRQTRELPKPEVEHHVSNALHSSGNRNPGSGEGGQGGAFVVST